MKTSLYIIFTFCIILNLNGQDTIPMLYSSLVDQTAASSCFGYYNSPPESPDGTKLVYLKFNSVPISNWGNYAALWLLDLETREKRKLVDISDANIHDGAMMCWIDNENIAYQDGRLSSINTDDLQTLQNGNYDYVSVVNINTLQKNTLQVRGRLGHHQHEGKILITSMHGLNGRWGLYEVDMSTGIDRLICNPTIFEPLVDQSLKQGRDVQYWKFLHAFYSPDGGKVGLRITIRGFEENVPGGGELNRLCIVDIDGTNPMIFGKIPLHFGWFDNDVIFGFAGGPGYAIWSNDPRMTGCYGEGSGMFLFNIGDGTSLPYCLEKISAPGNHSAVSPSKMWYASENMYGEDSIELRIYKKYETIPRVIAAKNSYGARTWGQPGTPHVNPCFSRDGNRLYFTEVVDGSAFQAKWVDLTELVYNDIPASLLSLKVKDNVALLPTTIPSFSPDQLNYTVEYGFDYTRTPIIEAVESNDGSFIKSITQPGSLASVTSTTGTVVVGREGRPDQAYVVNFIKTNDYIDGCLLANGTTHAGPAITKSGLGIGTGTADNNGYFIGHGGFRNNLTNNLIYKTPALSNGAGTLSFYWKKYDSTVGTDINTKFHVMKSSSGTVMNDTLWTIIVSEPNNVPDEWTKVEIPVDVNSQWARVGFCTTGRLSSGESRIYFIFDDIRITPYNSLPTGYPMILSSLTDELFKEKLIEINANGREINLKSSKLTAYQIYSITGMLIKSGLFIEQETIKVDSRGVYLVEMDGIVRKVLIY